MPTLSSPARAALAAAVLLGLQPAVPARAQTPAAQTAGQPTAIDRLLEARGARVALGDEPAEAAGPCRLPAPGPGQSVVLFSAHKGGAISSASVAGQNEPTTHSYVDIEPGRGPLYLVLSAGTPTVWSFRGATERVARAVLVTPSAAGAVGLAPARVEVVRDEGCRFAFEGSSTPEAVRARAGLRRALGRDADAVAGGDSIYAVSLPSGRETPAPRDADAPAPRGVDAAAWRTLLRNTPRMERVDPAAVAGARAVAYTVLPGDLGLAQLASQGALQPLGGRDYRLVSAIPHWPAGLTGAGSARFLLARGVPYPAGDPGHSCVLSEATGAPVTAAERGAVVGTGADSAESHDLKAELYCRAQ